MILLIEDRPYYGTVATGLDKFEKVGFQVSKTGGLQSV